MQALSHCRAFAAAPVKAGSNKRSKAMHVVCAQREQPAPLLEKVGGVLRNALLGATAAALVGGAAVPDSLAPPAWAGIGGGAVTNAKALLRYALPIDNKPIRKIQKELEAISDELRVPGSKSLGPVGKSVRTASSTLDREGAAITAAFAPERKAAGLAAVESLKQALTEFQAVLDAGDKQAVPIIQQKCLDAVGEVEQAMVRGFPFEVPQEYADLPQLKGRATVEMQFSFTDARLDNARGGTMTMVLDGYNAPVSAGDFADLVRRGFYDGMEVQRADGFVVQTGKPEGDSQGFVLDGKLRTIPLEVMVKGDKVPVYEETLEENGRFRESPVLPFNAFGTLAIAREEFDSNSGSSQVFWLLKESELTPTGANLLDGRYAVFGYVVDGAPLLKEMQVGDKIVSAKIVAGEENLPHKPDALHAASLSTALLVALMIVWATLGHRFASNTRFAGEGSTACLLGLVVGLVLLLARPLFHPDVLQSMLSFDPANFFVNFFTIAGYGILGTYVCFAIISLGLYLFLRSYLTFGDCLALGAILAATDSVAALQVITQDRFPLLYSVVFGEGVINDATSIVLLGTIQKFGLDSSEDLTFGLVCIVLLDFLYLLIASACLGMAFGLVTAYCLRAFAFHHVSQEVALIGMTAYLSYLMGDVLGLSGILALFVCAVAISHYALHNISAESRTTTIYAFHTLSYISEGIIFVYCGLDALDPLKWRNTSKAEVAWMFWILLLLLLLSRAAFVIPVTLAHNRYSDQKLSMREMATIWWAGMMRGAVSVALVYYFFDPHGMTDDPHLSTVITTTMVVVLISILGFGAATKPLLKWLMGPDDSAAAHCHHQAQGGSLEMGGVGGGGEHDPLNVHEYAHLKPSTAYSSVPFSGDPQWNSPQEAAPPTGGSRLAQSTGDEFGPMESAAPLQTHAGSGYAGGLSEVAIHGSSDGGTTSWPPANGSTGLPGKATWLLGRRPSVQLAADGRGTGAGGQAPAPAPHFPALPVGGLAGRQESAGFEYAPDSKAVMARINRWWKKLDEGYMQPRFGGPARAGGSSSSQSHAAAAAAAGPAAAQGTPPSLQGVQASDDSFTLPVRMA
ncbi:Peptidyl-prolyl cis-trans isomerase [Chlorella vulgaris]